MKKTKEDKDIERAKKAIRKIVFSRDDFLEAVARWHVRKVREAEGVTCGYVVLDTECDESGEDTYFVIRGGLLTELPDKKYMRKSDAMIARIVRPIPSGKKRR